MNTSFCSLYIFIFIQIINVLFLILDGILLLNNKTSITQYSVNRPFICFVIILFETGSPISLGIHFYYSQTQYL